MSTQPSCAHPSSEMDDKRQRLNGSANILELIASSNGGGSDDVRQLENAEGVEKAVGGGGGVLLR